MAITAEQFKEAARKAAAAGDVATARKLIARAKAADTAPAANADLSNAFQSAIQPQIGPPMPESILLRERTRKHFTDNPEGALTALAGGATQGATFGGSDELMAGLRSISPNVTYDQALAIERGRLDAARSNNPVAAYGGELAGAVALPLGAVSKGATLARTVGKSAAVTGGLSGIYGFLAGEGGTENRAREALKGGFLGAGIGAFIPGAGSVFQGLANARAGKKAMEAAAKGAPSSDELAAMGRAAYDRVSNAGVVIDPQAFAPAAKGITDDMLAHSMDPGGGVLSLTPQSARLAGIIDETATQPQGITFNQLEQLRRKAGIPAANTKNKVESALGSQAIGGLDDFVEKLSPGDLLAGDASTIADDIKNARAIWTKMRKSQMIEDAIEAGGDLLSGKSSGIRNQFKNILRNPKLSRGFSDAEKTAMRRVINGSIPEQLLNLIGGGIGQLSTIAAGGAAGTVLGPLGTILGTGAGAGVASMTRKAAGAVTGRKAEMVRSIMANGGMQTLPQASPALAQLIEAALRRGTAAGLRPQ